ncbi:MAG: ABC transporter permease subunit [Anaerolineae bacterium]|nr:ABC transporter permease subunit [Gemmatimonadaceae bacterium]
MTSTTIAASPHVPASYRGRSAVWRALALKAWRETRTRFTVGTLVVVGICAFFTLMHPWIISRWRLDLIRHPDWDYSPWFYRALEDYPFFIWHFLFEDMLQKAFVVFAVLLGVGGLTREAAYGTAGFTLSLPIRRWELLAARAAVAIAELVALGAVAAAVILSGSRVVGAEYPSAHALLHVSLLVAGALVPLAVSLWVSAVVDGEHAPVLLVLSAVGMFYFLVQPYVDGAPMPLFVRALNMPGVMAGNPGATIADVHWIGMGVTLLVGAAAFAGAFRRSATRDY